MGITVKEMIRIINGLPDVNEYKGVAIEVPIFSYGYITFRKVLIDFDYEWLIEIN